MVSKERKREAILHDKLQRLRAITHSHAMNEASIVLDASNYIKELKHKVDRLNQDIATAQCSNDHINPCAVTVEALEKGFLVNVQAMKSFPGLLVYILETFEDIGLTVVEARVSCADNFHLQVIGGENDEDEERINAPMVKRRIWNAIKNWTEDNE
ncbi:transcription factor bHLH61-like isoform X2 [Primulina eburnea]|uniref:transcription factor bHLH61-like isoform X2 n=1 Tax=Primulina eburnea TaxID=1245227 RepID=UPI003C6C3131